VWIFVHPLDLLIDTRCAVLVLRHAPFPERVALPVLQTNVNKL
jgi:hypothetical protein